VPNNSHSYSAGSSFHTITSWPPSAAEATAGYTEAYNIAVLNWQNPSHIQNYDHTNDGASARGTISCNYYSPSWPYVLYVVEVEMCKAYYSASVSTNVPCAPNWMILPAGTQTFHDYSGQGVHSGTWNCVQQDTPASVNAITSSVQFGAMVVPPLSDLVITGQSYSTGWIDSSPTVILRWQQRACNTDVFDARYNP